MKRFIYLISIFIITLLFIGCFTDEKATEYQKYLESAMNASYRGEFDEYLILAETTKEEAEELYDDTIKYMANQIMIFNSINNGYISDEAKDKYYELAKKVLLKTKYTVNEARKIDGIYQIKVEIEPIDIWAATYDEIEEYINEFNNKYPDYEGMLDEEILEAEEEYAINILEILEKYVDDMQYKDKVSKIVEIEIGDDHLYGISKSSWNDIDDCVMGIK